MQILINSFLEKTFSMYYKQVCTYQRLNHILFNGRYLSRQKYLAGTLMEQ